MLVLVELISPPALIAMFVPAVSAATTLSVSVTSASASTPASLVSSAVVYDAVVASKTALCACTLEPMSEDCNALSASVPCAAVA